MGPNPHEQYIRAKQQEERNDRIHRRDGRSLSRSSRVATGALLAIILVAFLAASVLWALGIIVLPEPAPLPAT